MLQVAAKIASTYDVKSENRTRFLDSAERIWSWVYAFDGGRGLTAPNGVMSTGALPERCCAAANTAKNAHSTSPGPLCANSRAPGMSYNHGLLMSSAALLYNATGSKDYLKTSLELLQAAIENLTDSEGAVRDVQRGSRVFSSAGRCLCGSDPGSDFFSFNGIFTAHLSYFAETLHKSGALSPDVQSKVLAMLKQNSDNAWSRSAAWPPFNSSMDQCSTSIDRKRHTSVGDAQTMLNRTSPKFHWWWSNGKNATLETPPDGQLWFARSGLQCSYPDNGTSSPVLWSGMAASEQACRQLCAENLTCIKYMWENWSGELHGRHGNNEDNYDDHSDTCPCFKCSGRRCSYPDCDRCSTLADEPCARRNMSDCYTTAKTPCACSSSEPESALSIACWLFRTVVENRSTLSGCTNFSTQYNVAAKRPLPPTRQHPWTTCQNRCGHTSPSLTSSGNFSDADVCFCDDACAVHLDCCLDFVEQCRPAEGQHPSCSGRCVNIEAMPPFPSSRQPHALAVPIQGGGYCYCDPQCGNIFTDNNSYGGCCADFAFECKKQPLDPVCFDARTQGSALHLFVSHHVVSELEPSDV